MISGLWGVGLSTLWSGTQPWVTAEGDSGLEGESPGTERVGVRAWDQLVCS